MFEDKCKSRIENFLLVLLIVLLFPFPKIVEEIFLFGIFVVACLLCCCKKNRIIKESFLYNFPYLIFELILLQIHSVRFTLVAHENGNHLLSVKALEWICTKQAFSESTIFSMLVYFSGVLAFLIIFIVTGTKKFVTVTERFNTEIENVMKKELSEESNTYSNCSFIIHKLQTSFITCSVICSLHLFAGIFMDMMNKGMNFSTAFYENIIFTIGSGLPFIGIYIILFFFVFLCCKE